MKTRPHFSSFSLCLRTVAFAAAGALAALLNPVAKGAPATWNATPTDGNWEASGSENNWSTGLGTFPGSLTVNGNTDTATFDTSSVTTINVASPLNIDNIDFGTASLAASAYTLGGSALEFTNGGSIVMASAAGASETIDNNLVIEPASSTTAGSLNLTNNATGSTNIMTIGGNISPDGSNTTTAQDTLNLTGSNTGLNDITGRIAQTGSGGIAISKSGAGTWELGGNGTSTASSINASGGTLQFGSATETPSLTLTGTGLTIGGGSTVNVDSGTLGLGSANGALTMNQGTYNQTGGTVSVSGSGISYLANNGSTYTSTFNVSGGSFTNGGTLYAAVRGTGIITVSGTGTFIAPTFEMLYNGASSSATVATVNLGTGTTGGTFETNALNAGSSTGTSTVNFNGGTLQATASSTTFLTGLTAANVEAGGAIINTNGNNDTIAQNLVTGTPGTTDGGLTKNGTGNLLVSGTNTYTGRTAISGGLLGINSDASLGADPSSPTANNIQITGTATLQDTANNVTLNANRGITVTDGVTATLDSSTNTFVVGGPISNASGTAATTLTLAGSGAGSGTLSGTLTDNSTGGYIINQSSSGSWTFGGNGTSTLSRGEISQNGGTFNFGSGTAAPSLTINGGIGASNIGVIVNSGNFNMNAGTLTVNNGQGLILNAASSTYAQTGGTFNTTGFIEFANTGGDVSTVTVSGGTLKTTNAGNDALDLSVRGTTTATVSGTGTINTPVLNMTTSQTSQAGTTSTFNLGNGAGNGGTLITGSIIPGTNTSTGARTFNFNGGTLQSSASSATFIAGGSTSTFNVKAGGAIINTSGFNDTIAQGLLNGTGGGADGGLTKNGAGILTLSGANTYKGKTTITAGTVALASGSSLTSGIIEDNSTVAATGGFNVAALSGGFTLALGQELAGNGTVTGQINTVSGSMINAGAIASPGTLTLNSGLNITTSGTLLTFRLNSPGTSDEILLTGGVFDQSAGTVVSTSEGSSFLGAGIYNLLDATGAGATPILADYSLADSSSLSGYNEALTVTGDILQLDVSPVPEPPAVLLLLGGLALVFLGVRRRHATV